MFVKACKLQRYHNTERLDLYCSLGSGVIEKSEKDANAAHDMAVLDRYKTFSMCPLPIRFGSLICPAHAAVRSAQCIHNKPFPKLKIIVAHPCTIKLAMGVT